MLRLVIFDLDETIVINDIPFSQVRKRVLERIGNKENPPHLYEFLREKGEKYVKILEEEEMRRAEHARIVDSLPKILEDLKSRGIKIAVLTRNSKKATMRILGKYAQEFDDIITRDDGFEPKPSPEAIFHLLSKYSVRGDECLVVGDYDYDIIAGKKAGCITVRIGNGSGDYRIEKIDDIFEIVNMLTDSPPDIL